MKTNAVRTLERLGVAYELRAYDFDPDDSSAPAVARRIGFAPEATFKTLVARGDRSGVLLAVVPGDRELDEKALARLSDDRRVELVPLKDVQPLTGYVRGGVTALACRKEYPVYLDDSARRFALISVSAGRRGLQVLLAPDDYARAVGARLGPIARSA